jgi:DNA-binding MarR family transcriptional regulator
MNPNKQIQKFDRLLQLFRRSGVYDRPHEGDLNDADIMVLFCIGFCDEHEHIKLSDIANNLRVTLPAVTHKVNALLEEGYVEKETSKDDLRVSYVHLTDMGLKYVKATEKMYYSKLRELQTLLGEEDMAHFMRILEKTTQLGKTRS